MIVLTPVPVEQVQPGDTVRVVPNVPGRRVAFVAAQRRRNDGRLVNWLVTLDGGRRFHRLPGRIVLVEKSVRIAKGPTEPGR